MEVVGSSLVVNISFSSLVNKEGIGSSRVARREVVGFLLCYGGTGSCSTWVVKIEVVVSSSAVNIVMCLFFGGEYRW